VRKLTITIDRPADYIYLDTEEEKIKVAIERLGWKFVGRRYVKLTTAEKWKVRVKPITEMEFTERRRRAGE